MVAALGGLDVLVSPAVCVSDHRVDEVLAVIGLAERAGEQTKDFSGGCSGG